MGQPVSHALGAFISYPVSSRRRVTSRAVSRDKISSLTLSQSIRFLRIVKLTPTFCRMNFALAHVLGATLQTAMFNAPLAVIVGWALVPHQEGTNSAMNLNFDVFNLSILILSILVVGNFLRDQKSNYLEGALCVIVYCIIAVGAFYFPKGLAPEAAEAAGEAIAARSRMLAGAMG
jgi:hypothetical protein